MAMCITGELESSMVRGNSTYSYQYKYITNVKEKYSNNNNHINKQYYSPLWQWP